MANVALSLRVVKPIKDGTRAVKGTVGRIVRKFKEFTLSHLLDLPEFGGVGCEIEQRGEQEIVHLYCIHPHEAALCPYCRQISTQVHDEKERCVRDLAVWGKCTFLHFSRRRFECEGCGQAFTERLPSIYPQRRQTRRFEQALYRQCWERSLFVVFTWHLVEGVEEQEQFSGFEVAIQISHQFRHTPITTAL